MRGGEQLVEQVRTIWTPEREVAVFSADLEPGTELDSLIRAAFCRLVQANQTITVLLDEPVSGTTQFNIVQTEQGRVVTFWHESGQ